MVRNCSHIPMLGCGKLKVSMVIYAGSVFSWQFSGVFGNDSFLWLRGMVIYDLKMSASMHMHTLLRVLDASNHNQ